MTSRWLLMLIVLLSLTGVVENPTVHAESRLAVHFMGISEGESTLIEFPNGYNLLVDTGSRKSGVEVVRFLHQHHVQKVNTLILTGPMEGHIGGVKEILEALPVDQLLVPAPLQQSLRKKTQFRGECLSVKEGETFTLPLGVQLRILHPGDPLSLSPEGNSMVFQIIHHRVKFLFTSDVNEETESRLLERYNVKSQILKVSDSGSNQASHPQFIKQVDAQVAIIFQDERIKPNDGVLETLADTWIDVYETSSHGTVSILSDGRSYQIQKENKKGYFQKGYFKEGKEQGKSRWSP